MYDKNTKFTNSTHRWVGCITTNPSTGTQNSFILPKLETIIKDTTLEKILPSKTAHINLKKSSKEDEDGSPNGSFYGITLLNEDYFDNIRINAFGSRFYEPASGINFVCGLKLQL